MINRELSETARGKEGQIYTAREKCQPLIGARCLVCCNGREERDLEPGRLLGLAVRG